MKNIIRKLTLVLLISGTFILLTGCRKKMESWAYDYEPGTEVIALYQNEYGVYKGERYDYEKDDKYITFKKGSEEIKLRYMMDGDKMLLYETSVYTAAEDVKPGSIVGTWLQENGWSYIFSETGEFSEEGIFFGHYSVDETNGTIKLMYEDPVPDIYLYYKLDGNSLTIDYPWPMTHTES